MTDEELAANMSKIRRKRLVTSPKFTKDELKKFRRDPRNNFIDLKLLTFLLFIQMVNILSINANGLRDQSKFQKLCSFCSENYNDVVAIQKTFWSDDLVTSFSKFWNGKIFYSCAETHRQGVAFLISKKVEHEVNYIQSFDGRCVHIQLQQDDKLINIDTSMSKLDRCGKTKRTEDKSYNSINQRKF
ncbi:unnamed protein product [Mytilus coruscus]|uniref:Uncharacterized protein n=1 Tax=Mytilus coruscus TaxID=42192 RepID=A0A6J8A3I5_MYTCO|nr:unnamed protein product [Mytilus coruscus]